MILVLLLIVSIETPYKVCIQESKEMTVFEWVQDTLFLIDILLNFLTGYYDNENNLVLEFKPIV